MLQSDFRVATLLYASYSSSSFVIALIVARVQDLRIYDIENKPLPADWTWYMQP